MLLRRFFLTARLLLLSGAAYFGCIGSLHAQATAGYTVKPGDTLEISVWKEPDLQRTVLVRPDGQFSFPLVGEVDARGKTVAELNKTVSDRLTRYISDAVVTISVQEIKGNKIYVLGQVNKPGEFIVNPSVNIMQALSMAGGMTPFAATNDIIVLRGQGKQQNAMAFRYNDVVRGRSLDTNIELLSGDIVVVP
ncbi:MAG TPA: polysaccharide biosynthesis/export family protein [Steroidobacteraceae bacterium]|jgi:polysaccharide export outer membrane protein|nr:polysaccharide biosynthesis/export family protein [Steroidobacteraceae bacterium]